MNWYNHGNTVKSGDQAEALFKELAERNGFLVALASRSEDMHHVDMFLDDDHSVQSVDVKSRKKLSRKDSDYCDDWVYIEFSSPSGRPGWLYSEETDLIAFEGSDDFFVIELVKLRELAEAMVDRTERVSVARDAKYKVYNRRDQEEVALIETKWVRALSKWVWSK